MVPPGGRVILLFVLKDYFCVHCFVFFKFFIAICLLFRFDQAKIFVLVNTK